MFIIFLKNQIIIKINQLLKIDICESNEKFTYILHEFLNDLLSLKIYFSFLIDCS